MLTVLKTTNLTKNFGHEHGIFDVSLTVEPGEIVGFVGPNGAGKSTTINILAGLVKQDSGAVELFEQTVSHSSIYKVMPRIGLLLSEPTLNLHYTAEQTFTESADLLGIDARKNWQHMSETLGLDVHKKIKKLSLGNKKKVGIINALLHNPELLIMDEPTSGLDPIIQAKFSGMLRAVAQRGGAVLLSSHDMSEIQHICDRIVMIRSGKIIISDTTDALLEKAAKVFTLKQPPRELMHKIIQVVSDAKTRQSGIYVTVISSDYKSILQLLAANKFYDFYLERPNLEEMFKEYYA